MAQEPIEREGEAKQVERGIKPFIGVWQSVTALRQELDRVS